jgi:hypothetical protein
MTEDLEGNPEDKSLDQSVIFSFFTAFDPDAKKFGDSVVRFPHTCNVHTCTAQPCAYI